MSNRDERIPTRRPQRRLPSNRPLATVRRKKEKLRGGWVQSANFASECARKWLILSRREIGDSPRPERYAYFAPESN